LINPNNPDGKIWHPDKILNNGKLTIIDESFCDLVPNNSLINYANNPGVIVLKLWEILGVSWITLLLRHWTTRDSEKSQT